MKEKTENQKPATEAVIPSTITELRDELLKLFGTIGTDGVNLQVAKEKSNAAGKIIKSAAVQLEYAQARKEKPNIPFLK